MERIYLQGSEEVGQAASMISFAAQEMHQAAREFQEAAELQARTLDAFVGRVEEILARLDMRAKGASER